MIRHVIDSHTQPIPSVLEIPSKDHPYDASKDSILRRAKVRFIISKFVIFILIYASMRVNFTLHILRDIFYMFKRNKLLMHINILSLYMFSIVVYFFVIYC